MGGMFVASLSNYNAAVPRVADEMPDKCYTKNVKILLSES